MVFNSLIVVSVAHVSADAWQQVACLPERLSSSQVLDLVCFPLQELGRLALCFWTFLCVPPPDSYYLSRYDSDDSDSDSDTNNTVDYDDYYYHPQSD